MFHRILCLLTIAGCLLSAGLCVQAAEVDSDSVYCFTDQDFSARTEPLRGVCITGLPAPGTGTVMLGTRVVQPGDILTADQVRQMTFLPVRTETDSEATVTYLPIYEDHVDTGTALTISIRGKEDKAPVIEDTSLETYKNIPNEGKLKATDPEGQALTFSVTRQPRRGDVAIREDGSFTYTPKKNKVGVDSFTVTATDPAGNVSKEATVTVKILKPSQSPLYEDTVGQECRFEAEWLKNTGLFAGETLGGKSCFQPEKAVTRGEFLAMLTKLLDVPQPEGSTAMTQSAPRWLQPYLAAALRSGMLSGLDLETFDPHGPITLEEARLLVRNAVPDHREAMAVWNETEEAQALTRADCALLLYSLK